MSFAVLRRPQSLHSRSHKTFCQPNSQSPIAGHGPVEGRQRPDHLKLGASALTRLLSNKVTTPLASDFKPGTVLVRAMGSDLGSEAHVETLLMAR